jgi:hypothetical protein
VLVAICIFVGLLILALSVWFLPRKGRSRGDGLSGWDTSGEGGGEGGWDSGHGGHDGGHGGGDGGGSH